MDFLAVLITDDGTFSCPCICTKHHPSIKDTSCNRCSSLSCDGWAQALLFQQRIPSNKIERKPAFWNAKRLLRLHNRENNGELLVVANRASRMGVLMVAGGGGACSLLGASEKRHSASHNCNHSQPMILAITATHFSLLLGGEVTKGASISWVGLSALSPTQCVRRRMLIHLFHVCSRQSSILGETCSYSIRSSLYAFGSF